VGLARLQALLQGQGRQALLSKKIRGLAWVVIKWAKAVKPRVICLENVEEFQTWGPLDEDGMPCPRRKGLTFRRWVAQLRNLRLQGGVARAARLRLRRTDHPQAPVRRGALRRAADRVAEADARAEGQARA
jgi:site-specific DNA-cytosine methylase